MPRSFLGILASVPSPVIGCYGGGWHQSSQPVAWLEQGKITVWFAGSMRGCKAEGSLSQSLLLLEEEEEEECFPCLCSLCGLCTL